MSISLYIIGDSGAQLSMNSDLSNSGNGGGLKNGLSVLKEQESPVDFAPFDQEVYGCSVSISSNASNQSRSNNVYQTPLEAKNNSVTSASASASNQDASSQLDGK